MEMGWVTDKEQEAPFNSSSNYPRSRVADLGETAVMGQQNSSAGEGAGRHARGHEFGFRDPHRGGDN